MRDFSWTRCRHACVAGHGQYFYQQTLKVPTFFAHALAPTIQHVARKRIVKRQRPVPPERRVDVTRIEYEHLCEMVERNAEAIRRLQMADEIQLRRTAEVQAEIERLTRKQMRLPRAESTPPSWSWVQTSLARCVRPAVLASLYVFLSAGVSET
jgi:hypothetical protein